MDSDTSSTSALGGIYCIYRAIELRCQFKIYIGIFIILVADAEVKLGARRCWPDPLIKCLVPHWHSLNLFDSIWSCDINEHSVDMFTGTVTELEPRQRWHLWPQRDVWQWESSIKLVKVVCRTFANLLATASHLFCHGFRMQLAWRDSFAFWPQTAVGWESRCRAKRSAHLSVKNGSNMRCKMLLFRAVAAACCLLLLLLCVCCL